MFRPRISYRAALPNATVKTLYMTADGLGTAVSQAFTANTAVPSATNVEKAAGTNFAATAVGCMLRCVSAVQAANVGAIRQVVTRNGNDQLTVNAFPAVMTATDTFVLERIITQAAKRVRLIVEAGGHCHVSFNKGAALVTDRRIDDTEAPIFEIMEGATQIDILTDSDVHLIYVNVEAE